MFSYRKINKVLLVLLHVVLQFQEVQGGQVTDPHNPCRFIFKSEWEEKIQEFETSDLENAPQLGGVLFVGASTIRRWDLKKYFSSYPTINRGFGGSGIDDLITYRERIITRYKPTVVIIKSGDNDIGKYAPQEIASHVLQLIRDIKQDLPQVRVGFISLTAAPCFPKHVPLVLETNALLNESLKDFSHVHFIDITNALNINNRIDHRAAKSLFLGDRKHLNDQGYTIISSHVNAFLEKEYPSL